MKKVVSERSTVVATRDQVSSDLGNEVAILNLPAGMYYGLDDVGVRVWDLVQEPRTVSEVQNVVLEEYDVEPARGKHEVLTLIQELADEGLIEVRDETPA